MRCLSLLPLLSACAVAPEGLRLTPEGDGPLVVVDWEALPLPELPFPNDLAARPDPGSVTGLRLNISEQGVTELEREARQKINELVGFGIYSAITVSFEEPLDLDNIAARHRDDPLVGEVSFLDDAILVFNVDPDSDQYLQPVYLDLGHGNFPMDLDRTDRYFTNDARSESPAFLFETVNEDLNGNGVLDPGEDTDSDGLLDVANIYPFDSDDPRADLLTWYERQTDTLILRPILPLEEESTYAVVLTERLVGEDGEPVRSPWEYVNHTRQTQALGPLVDALPLWGLDVEDVAFAWTFTTGRVTGDLVDIRRGLDGEGPWPWLAESFPATVTQALQVHSVAGEDDVFQLPIANFVGPLVANGLLGDEESAEVIEAGYLSFTDRVVGGAYEVPYLLTDRDDGGLWDADEWWQLDPLAGTMSVAPQRVPFTCFIPTQSAEYKAPFPVVLFGHGYGSSRFDATLGAYALNRVGVALCAIDFPGHGPTINPDDLPLIEAVLSTYGLTPFLHHLQDARYRDLDNDGLPDSGGDQWISDSFHTRDMVRQAAVDWMWLIRSFQHCGEGEMDFILDGGESAGFSQTTCDWDGDGEPDIGGPDVDYHIFGGSLGGINAGVAAAVMPDIETWVPVVAGGGLLDIGMRSPLSGVVEAVPGRLITPIIIGVPDDKTGTTTLSQIVISNTDDITLPFASLGALPPGGRVVVENLSSGEVREAWIRDDGAFRLSIPADAPDPFEKRELAGMPQVHDGDVYTVTDNAGLGDLLAVTVFDASGAEIAYIDTFEGEVLHEGVTMLAGSPLVAGSSGLGHTRGSPDLRRLIGVSSAALEPGDPISYAPYYSDPIEVLGGVPANVLLMPTPGDMIVAVNAEVALARAAGMVEFREVDDRYGVSVNQWLIDAEVVRGLEQFGPWTDDKGTPILFDADDLDNGINQYDEPSDSPLRYTVETSSGQSGLRMPYVSPQGSHGFGMPDPGLDFDINTFSIYQIARYVQTRGAEISDDPCLEDGSCDFFREITAGTDD